MYIHPVDPQAAFTMWADSLEDREFVTNRSPKSFRNRFTYLWHIILRLAPSQPTQRNHARGRGSDWSSTSVLASQTTASQGHCIHGPIALLSASTACLPSECLYHTQERSAVRHATLINLR